MISVSLFATKLSVCAELAVARIVESLFTLTAVAEKATSVLAPGGSSSVSQIIDNSFAVHVLLASNCSEAGNAMAAVGEVAILLSCILVIVTV